MDDIRINSSTSINTSMDPAARRQIRVRPRKTDENLTAGKNIKFEEAFKKAKEYVKINNTKLSLSYDKEHNQPVIYVLDSETDEVIRRVPPEKLIELSGDEEKLKGFFVEKDI